jgi:Ni,Fe-hydrogenase I cytochrome b subunit
MKTSVFQSYSKLYHILSMLSRLVLAVVGGYLCTVALVTLASRLISLLFGIELAGALMGMLLVSFLLYSLIIMAVFAATRLGRAWLLLSFITAASALLSMLPILTMGVMP